MSTDASTLTGPDRFAGNVPLYRGKVGLVCFFVSEAHLFGVLLIAFLLYLGQSRNSSMSPARLLGMEYTIPGTVFLLSSSATVALAGRSLDRGSRRRFTALWLTTVLLGVLFLVMTGLEWNDLIVHKGLRLGTNLFGSTYFTLIGLHATHVSLGLVAMLVVLGLVARGAVTPQQPAAAELVGWYWHFVDAVWVVLFIVVYVIGRMD